MTGRLNTNWRTSSRRPKGAGTVKCRTCLPMADQSRIGIERIAATRKRFRMSRTMASIDIAAWPPWPIASCGDMAGAG